MLTETTVTKLREMHLSVMANALKDQTSDSQYVNMAFEDRLGLLVDAEWTARKNNRLQKLIRRKRKITCTYQRAARYEIMEWEVAERFGKWRNVPEYSETALEG